MADLTAGQIRILNPEDQNALAGIGYEFARILGRSEETVFADICNDGISDWDTDSEAFFRLYWLDRESELRFVEDHNNRLERNAPTLVECQSPLNLYDGDYPPVDGTSNATGAASGTSAASAKTIDNWDLGPFLAENFTPPAGNSVVAGDGSSSFPNLSLSSSSVNVVPEPGSLFLLVMALIPLRLLQPRRR